MASGFLGIETSGAATGVAVLLEDRVVHETVLPGICHNEVLPGLIAGALAGSGLTAGGLAGIGVTIGPGMFTSLRVGLAAAKGLALPHAIRLKGVNTLRALAAGAGEAGLPVLALVDARKHEVYAALYHGGRTLLEPGVFSPARLAARLGPLLTGPALLAGDGVEPALPALLQLGVELRPTGIERPLPRVIAAIARDELAAGRADDVETLEPVYLRRTDAELNREKKA